MHIYMGQDLPAPPHPVGVRLSWVIGMGNSSLLEGGDRLSFVVLEEKEAEVVEFPGERVPEFCNKTILFGPS
jgi:hypothetical protein